MPMYPPERTTFGTGGAQVKIILASVAQLVERRTRNAQVIGSIPVAGSKKSCMCGILLFTLSISLGEFLLDEVFDF